MCTIEKLYRTLGDHFLQKFVDFSNIYKYVVNDNFKLFKHITVYKVRIKINTLTITNKTNRENLIYNSETIN